jgi:hypothetical protein
MLDSFVRKEPQTLNLKVYQQKEATPALQVTTVLKEVLKVFHAQLATITQIKERSPNLIANRVRLACTMILKDKVAAINVGLVLTLLLDQLLAAAKDLIELI